MQERIQYPALIALAALLAGCVSAQATMLSSETYDPVPPEEVTIYLSEEDIQGEWEKVAILDLEGSDTWTTRKQMYEKARKKAGGVGCNGVLVPEGAIEEASAGEQVANALLGTGADREGEFIGIRVQTK